MRSIADCSATGYDAPRMKQHQPFFVHEQRILVMALERIPGTPTREGIVDALEAMDGFDVGLGRQEKLAYGPRDHDASHCVWPTVLRDGALVPFAWGDATQLLQEGVR